MKIVDMSGAELRDAIEMMGNVPRKDSSFSGWNFDVLCWRDKLIELLDEYARRDEFANR